MMALKVNNLNGDFGVIIEGVSREDLCSSEFRQQAHQLWIKNGGLIGLRGIELNKLTSNELMDWSAHFGDVDHDNFVAREDKKVDGLPILRIGNTRDESGKSNSNFSKNPKASMAYRFNVSSRTTDRFGISLPESAAVWGRNTIRRHSIIFKKIGS